MINKHEYEHDKTWVGECPCCKMFQPNNATRRRNTAYHNDKLNWLTSCRNCYDMDYEYYADRWAEYYDSR